MIARTDQVKTIAETRPATLAPSPAAANPAAKGQRALVAAGELQGFRCAVARVETLDDGTLAIDAEAASALKLNPGDRLCWAPR